jgi:hypothetical protein
LETGVETRAETSVEADCLSPRRWKPDGHEPRVSEGQGGKACRECRLQPVACKMIREAMVILGVERGQLRDAIAMAGLRAAG